VTGITWGVTGLESDMDNLRTCRICKQDKTTDDFYKHKQRADGLRTHCKDCSKLQFQLIKPSKKQRAASSKKWADNNRDFVRQTDKNYKQKNPQKVLSAIHKRNAQKRNNGVFKILDKELLKLKNSSCFYCDERELITMDHIIPLSKGGNHSIGNLISACSRCNSSKNNKLLIEFLQYRRKQNVRNDLAGSQDSDGKPGRG
jgi:5-methylcytosine-specific restriction endonuclease McrA